MIRQRTTPLFLMLVLMATAALQVACAENDSGQDEAQASQEQSGDSAQQATDSETDGQQNNDGAADTQLAANDSGSGGDEAADSGDDGADASGGSDKPYNVSCDGDDCKAGEAVVTGYEKYHAHCHTCHGPNASGSTFAPSLVDRGKDLTQGEFTGIVANGKKRYDSTTGGYSVMPAWKDNPEVMQNVSSLWAYVKARADGALPGGEPAPME